MSHIDNKIICITIIENNFILFYEHDPVIECSRVVQTEKGFRASDMLSLADILRVED